MRRAPPAIATLAWSGWRSSASAARCGRRPSCSGATPPTRSRREVTPFRRDRRDILAAMVPAARLGRYEVLAKLAAGGMGEIFLARLEGAAGFEKLYVIKK